MGDGMAQAISGFPFLPESPAGYRFWAGAEALLWWEKDEHLPANLVTSGLPTDAVPGALGQPNTLGLSGPGNVNFGPFAGLRLFAGAWLDPQQILGVEAGGFVLQEQGQGFNFNSTVGGNPLLALRHFDAASGAQDAFVIASPSSSTGGIAVQTDSQLWGADANVLHTFFWTRSFRLVGLFGFRYLDLSEALSIQTRSMAISGSAVSFLGQSFAAPSYDLTADRFNARNQFFGGQVGLRSEYYFSHFFVAAIGKLAVGQTDEVRNALGVSTLQIGTTPVQSTAGGLFAVPSNSGHFVNEDLGIVPELQLKGGVLLTRWLRATIGYDVLYWSRVLRASDTLDLTVDTRQVPTSPAYQPGVAVHSPSAMFNPSSFWVQGLTLGLEFTY
ncbi:MAG TPA: BBP7 family outer membrane beta-barrel protein [Terriglobia bacterium]|nr:BBP7 family outer membrane beta-barrel protein [Terriglobia bacterium]